MMRRPSWRHLETTTADPLPKTPGMMSPQYAENSRADAAIRASNPRAIARRRSRELRVPECA